VKAFNKLIQQTLKVDNSDSEKNDVASVQPLSPDFNWIETDNYTGRKHLRYHFRLRAMIRKIQRVKGNLRTGPAEKIIVHNISRSGIGLLNPKPLKLNENIMISIAGNDSEQQTNLIAVVIRCVDHADGWFTIGTKFHQQQSDSLIDEIRNITPVRE
ncbi:MAG: PilZ domain-containing protein, partial [Sedimentisphaerales bacterium]|nr:PilZ domain-containing protein [Sedimentisphaerales bacterium]